MSDPNQEFKSAKEPEPQFDYYFDCVSFGTDLCEGECDHCDAPKDTIELLAECKW